MKRIITKKCNDCKGDGFHSQRGNAICGSCSGWGVSLTGEFESLKPREKVKHLDQVFN